jgi:outer membrane protein
MKRLFGLILPLFLTALARAEVPLTWQECVKLAARHNPELLAALASVESSRADYRGSYNALLPQLNLSHSYTRSFTTSQRVLADGTIASANSYSKSWRADGTVRLDLIDVANWTNIQLAAAELNQSEASLRSAGATALLDLYTAFTDLLHAQQEKNVNSAIRDTRKKNADMVSLRYESGRESRGNQLNTQAQLLEAEAALAQSDRQIRVAQRQLVQVLGKENFELLVVTGTWSVAGLPEPKPDFERFLAKQPQVAIQAATVERARLAVKSAHSVLWPTLGLSYTRGRQGNTEFPQNPYWSFSGTVNYALFSGGPTAAYYAGQSAQRALEEAQLQLRAVRAQSFTDMESAWAAFAAADDNIKVQKAFLTAAIQRKEESDVRYQNGLMSFEDWNRVVQESVNYQTSFLRAQQNLVMAEARWRFTTGQQLGDAL